MQVRMVSSVWLRVSALERQISVFVYLNLQFQPLVKFISSHSLVIKIFHLCLLRRFWHRSKLLLSNATHFWNLLFSNFLRNRRQLLITYLHVFFHSFILSQWHLSLTFFLMWHFWLVFNHICTLIVIFRDLTALIRLSTPFNHKLTKLRILDRQLLLAKFLRRLNYTFRFNLC